MNGKDPSAVRSQEAGWDADAFLQAERVKTVRVVLSGSGRTFEWKYADGCVVLTDVGTHRLPVPGFVLVLTAGWGRKTEVRFDLGADGLFRIESEEHYG